jgi:hypothetical protein
VNVQFLKYAGSPCFTQDEIQMRETRLEATTPLSQPGSTDLVRVLYKGPLSKVVDDSGLTFIRGGEAQIPVTHWQQIAASSLADSFVRLAVTHGLLVSCGTK